MTKSIYKLNLIEQEAVAKLLSNKRCGLDTGTNDTFFYNLSIEAIKLGEDGFVIDNEIAQEINNLYNQGGYYQASCEVLAGGIANFAIDKLNGRATRVVVQVRNNTGNVEVVWDKGDQLPESPRYATWVEEQEENNLRNPPKVSSRKAPKVEQSAC